jgi:4-hydroxy-2-oxoglutarate aldolase
MMEVLTYCSRMLYNFPSLTAGIDLDSDLIIEIAKAAPNVCGVKLTCVPQAIPLHYSVTDETETSCGNVGKLTRITAVVDSAAFKEKYPRKNKEDQFLVIDGLIDFLLPSMSANASGAITGLANFAPVSSFLSLPLENFPG